MFHQALDTKAQSLVFVKRMVVIAVSSITYLRGIFPEDSYRSRYLEGISIHTDLLMDEHQAVWNISYSQFWWMLFFRFVYQSPQTGLFMPWSPQTRQMVILFCMLFLYSKLLCLYIQMYSWKYMCNASLKCKI